MHEDSGHHHRLLRHDYSSGIASDARERGPTRGLSNSAPRRLTAVRPLATTRCDHTAETEVPGHILGTDLRSAHVPTSAHGNAYTALDNSICSPHAQQAGPNCTRSRRTAKLEFCGPHLPSLLQLNISHTLERLWPTPPGHIHRFALPH